MYAGQPSDRNSFGIRESAVARSGRPAILMGRSISEGGRAGKTSEEGGDEGCAGEGGLAGEDGFEEDGDDGFEGEGEVIFLEGPQEMSQKVSSRANANPGTEGM
jgi:hypothetical protein